MSTETLKSYIAQFRDWLASEAAPALQGDDAHILAGWRDDLASAEQQLAVKPELPIAFLGPSQQGKSSLINALLGQNVLAVGGAVGACTCVITSVHYHPHAFYRAEVDFISLTDWQAELTAMADALTVHPSVDDTDQDREEREAAIKTAREKVEAVYGEAAHGNLAEILTGGKLGLPDEIANLMETGRPLVFQEKNAQTFRNTVRRWLVGRDQHKDAQFWPLLSRVRIYGNFDILANGVVLVDLPGLNDPNPAREQVTLNYLQDAQYIWLICNSQTGIDRVFTNVLRDEGLLFRLFLEGRLGAFSVIATRVDDINLQAVLEQMGVEVDEFDGDVLPVLDFRRSEIRRQVHDHLLSIGKDIAGRGVGGRDHPAFLDRVRAVPVFAVATMAYMYDKGRMPLYQGMKLAAKDTDVPQLVEHLHAITREQSYKTQVETVRKRLELLYEQVRHFFFERIRQIERDSEEVQREWDDFVKMGAKALHAGRDALKKTRIRFAESLDQRCSEFERQVAGLDTRAIAGLKEVFERWDPPIAWNTLLSVAKAGGVFRSNARGRERELNFNLDIARAYLDLVPFVLDDFFGAHLSELTREVSHGAHETLRMTAARITGAMSMLRHQPAGVGDSMEASLRTADESFQLQTGGTRAEINRHIRQARQALTSGMIGASADFMKPAYKQASAVPVGDGRKKKMLDILIQHAREHAPKLFIAMRQDLVEGVTELKSSMTPQLTRIVNYGSTILDQFEQNLSSHQIATAAQRPVLEAALGALPQMEARHGRIRQESWSADDSQRRGIHGVDIGPAHVTSTER